MAMLGESGGACLGLEVVDCRLGIVEREGLRMGTTDIGLLAGKKDRLMDVGQL